MRIVTRGLGPSQMIVTRGYGLSEVVVIFWGEIIDLISRITTSMDLISKIGR
jgi:hypothetical protein